MCSAVKHGTHAQWSSSFLRKVAFSRGLCKSKYRTVKSRSLEKQLTQKGGREEGGREAEREGEKEHLLSLRPRRDWRGRMLLWGNLAF